MKIISENITNCENNSELVFDKKSFEHFSIIEKIITNFVTKINYKNAEIQYKVK